MTTVPKLVEMYLQSNRQKYTARSLAQVVSVLKRFAAHCGESDCANLSPDAVREFCVSGDPSADTVNGRKRVVQTAWRWGIAARLIPPDCDPVTGVSMPRCSDGRVEFLTKSDCVLLLASCESIDRMPHHAVTDPCGAYCAALCGVAMLAGLRKGEALALQWADVDFGRGVIHVRNSDSFRTKSGKNRTV